MNKDVKQIIKQSLSWLSVDFSLWPMPRVWPPSALRENCSADLPGPEPTGESVTVIGDHFRRFVEVVVVKSPMKAKDIEEISPIFARFGVTFSLRTDNGPHLKLEESLLFLCMLDN